MEILAANKNTLLNLMMSCRCFFDLGETILLREIWLPRPETSEALKSALEAASFSKSTRFGRTKALELEPTLELDVETTMLELKILELVSLCCTGLEHISGSFDVSAPVCSKFNGEMISLRHQTLHLWPPFVPPSAAFHALLAVAENHNHRRPAKTSR
jgi:hypothetical protein